MRDFYGLFKNFYSLHSTLFMSEFSYSRLYDLQITRHKNNKTIASIAKMNTDWQLLCLHEPSPIVSTHEVSFHRRSIHNHVPSLKQFSHCVQIISQDLAVIARIFKFSFFAFSCLPDPHLCYLILFLITLFVSTFQKDTNVFSFRDQLWIVLQIAG